MRAGLAQRLTGKGAGSKFSRGPGVARGGRRGAWRRVQARRIAAAALAGSGVWAAVSAFSPPEPVREHAIAAAADLPAGHRLGAADLQPVAIDPQTAPGSRLTDGAGAVGQVLAYPLERGELVTAARLRPASGLTKLSSAERALHVPVADRGSVALVRPGDRVDVVAVASGETVGAGLLVLSIDQAGAAGGLSGPSEAPGGVVLAVPPAVVAKIVPAAVGGEGGVQLAVRADAAKG